MNPPLKHNFQHPVWYSALSGLLALLIGIGLCRFAYTPLIPALINHGWLTKAGAGYIGTINFVGYLLGAFLSHRLSEHFSIPILIRISLIFSVISLALCAFDFGFAWFSFWRFVAGITGAFLMVLTPGVILQNVSIRYRGRVVGIAFTGAGLGIVISGFLFPSLATRAISMAWLSAAVIAFIASFIAWFEFSDKKALKRNSTNVNIISTASIYNHRRILLFLAIAYALYGIGTVPHSLFLVDYVHRELGLSIIISGTFWSIFGIGSLIGPFFAGFIADLIGTYKSLIISFVICCIAITIVLFNHITVFYVLSSFLMGAFLPGIATLISARLVEIVGTEFHPFFWGKMTLYYATSQALSAYVMSFLLHRGVNYTGCFIIANVAFVLALIFITLAKNSTYHVLEEKK